MVVKMSLELGKLAKNIFNTFLRQFGTTLANLVVIIIIARYFGPEGNGVYSVAMLFSQLLANFLNLGITPASVYYINTGQASLRDAWNASVKIFIALSIIGGSIGLIVILFFSESLFPSIPKSALFLGLCIFPLSLFHAFISGIFQAVQDFKGYNLTLFSQALTALALAGILAGLNIQNVELFLGSFMLSVVIASTLGAIVLYRRHLKHAQPPTQSIKRKLLNYGYKAHLGSLVSFFNSRLDLLIVNALIGASSAGVYAIAVQIGEKVWLISKAASTVLLPRLSELAKDEAKRKALTPMMSRWMLLVSILTSLVLLGIGQLLIVLIFGVEYRDAFIPLALLLPGIVLGSSSRVLAIDTSSRGRPEINFYVSIVTIVINVIANFILIPLYGLAGASIATSLSYFITFILRLFIHSHMAKVSILGSVFLQKSDIQLLHKLRQKLTQRN